jgi:hypothetical protein
MKRYIFLAVLALYFSACNPQAEKKVAREQAKYTTTADSKIYFKNVRQYYYDREVPPNTKLEVFRFSSRNKSAEQPVINVSIVNNWMYDEAYVLLEPGPYFEESDTITVLWTDAAETQSGEYAFTFGSKEMHFRFAAELYGSIQAGHSLQVRGKDGDWLPLFANRTDQDNFRKTMVDFYRLVNLL